MDTSNSKIDTLHKEHWVNISLKYDEFWSFVYNFLIPVWEFASRDKIISGFYYKNCALRGEVLQLRLKVSPFNLERKVKPLLQMSLRHYFDEQTSDQSIVIHGNDRLSDRDAMVAFDLTHVNLLGIDTYYTDSIAHVIGRPGARALTELYVDSSRLILNMLRDARKENWTVEDSIENNLSFHCALLYIFLKDNTEIYHFLAWVTSSMLNSFKKEDNVVDLFDWKFQAIKGMVSNFEDSKDAILGYVEFVLETIQSNSAFSENGLNQWITICYACKNRLTTLEQEGRLIYDDHSLPPDQIIFCDTVTKARTWQIVYSIVSTINGQLGIAQNYLLELDMFYMMKQSFQILSTRDNAKTSATSALLVS